MDISDIVPDEASSEPVVDEHVTPMKDGAVQIDVGMIFDGFQQIYDLYNEYARDKGFGVRRRNSRKNYVLLVCNRHEFGKDMDESESSKRLTSISRCGCKASLSASKIGESDQWQITKFSDDHNHNLVSSKSVTLLRSHKGYSAAAKSLTESFSMAGVPIARIPHVFGTRNVPFGVKDCYNHMKNVRSIIYEAGDAQAVQVYCTQQHELDPNFFYSIQFDDECRMRNFFWVDSRSRRAYEKFGDVITFDTTYRTNKYSMPFAPFIGVNHHLQSVLFGCALMYDETEDTFKWAFETWLLAMKGRAPAAIITDQDAAMAKAIRQVFPEARHRLCLWHISKKFPEKLQHIYQDNGSFKREFNNLLYNSRSKESFEHDWFDVIARYRLEDNQWLQGLFDIRESWVPIFNRDTFFAGMTTTQRSESINAFFNTFVHSGMTLREFVVKYEIALATRYESYRKEEFDSCQKERRLQTNLAIEEQASSVYTRAIFSKFSEELSPILKLSKKKIDKVGFRTTYQVWNSKDIHDDHMVCIDFTTNEVVCTCMNFEFMGILCRHILTIYHAKDIVHIPERYILQRWKKYGNKVDDDLERVSIGGSHKSLSVLAFQMMYTKLDEYAMKSEEAYKFIHGSLTDIVGTAAEIVESDKDTFDTGVASCPSASNVSVNLKDPIPSQTKGRKRIKGGMEISQTTRNTCGNCGQLGHNRRGCRREKNSTL